MLRTKIVMVAGSALMGLFIAGCGQGATESLPQTLVGQWQLQGPATAQAPVTLAFSADGRFISPASSGRYEQSSFQLILDTTDSVDARGTIASPVVRPRVPGSRESAYFGLDGDGARLALGRDGKVTESISQTGKDIVTYDGTYEVTPTAYVLSFPAAKDTPVLMLRRFEGEVLASGIYERVLTADADPPVSPTCASDSDCTVVPDGCCDCENGGRQVAVSVDQAREQLATNQESCKNVSCPAVISTDPSCQQAPRCSRGLCVLGPVPANADHDER